jgi:hypothetical protein
MMDVNALQTLFENFASVASSVKSHHFDHGNDHGEYLNFTFETDDVATLWKDIQTHAYRHPQLGAALTSASLAVCEGEQGWDDYLLLHHYDPGVKRDAL